MTKGPLKGLLNSADIGLVGSIRNTSYYTPIKVCVKKALIYPVKIYKNKAEQGLMHKWKKYAVRSSQAPKTSLTTS